MTPEQKIKHAALVIAYSWRDDPMPEITASNVDDLFEADDDGNIQDAVSEVRGGQVKTGLPCDWSRHYESESVAYKTPDGSWVGWTHWYGGGKHGEPEAIDWMDSAYDLTVTEEEKVVTVRTFSKADAQPAQ